MDPFVSIIIPTHNGVRFLPRCLGSAVRECASVSGGAEILVVDNGSVDGTVNYCNERFLQVCVLPQAGNFGFAQACNIGVRAARGTYCLLLNQDAWLERGALSTLLRFAEEGKYAVAGPRILNPDGSLQGPGMRIDFLGEPTWAPDDRNPFFVSGTVLLVKRSDYLELAGFDERFFAYFEECDLQWRAQLRGKCIGYVPSAQIYHLGDSGTPDGQYGARLDPLSWRRQFLGRRNQLAMLIKNYAVSSLIWVLPLWVLTACIECLGALARGHARQVTVYGAAVAWNLRHLPGTWRRRHAVQAARVIGDHELAARFGPPFARLRKAIRMLAAGNA